MNSPSPRGCLARLAAVFLFAFPLASLTNAAPLRIMPLGDSITAGYTDNPNWNVPFEFGYRRQLYHLLTNAGYDFLFVGASLEPFSNTNGDPTKNGTVSPSFDLRPIGQNGHRGYGGRNITTTTSNVVSQMASDQPDIILLMIGINGISTSSPAQLDTLVNTIFTNRPAVRLIVAQITPRSTYNADIFNYNTYIRDTLLPKYVAQGRNITTVDQYRNFLSNPADPASIDATRLSNGINHPTNAAYDTKASTWFTGIQAIVTPVIVDTDDDDLPDPWETAKAGNLTDLTRTGDFDQDQLSDTAEYQLSKGAYPLIDPTERDSDSDSLDDGAEIAGAGTRPPTNPTLADTDGDNISDFNENNTGSYIGILQTGTNPILRDTDGDGQTDGAEVLAGTHPLLASSPGAPVIAGVSSGTELIYANDVSSTDLLHGLPAANVLHTGWNTGNSASPTKLNDGLHGASNVPVEGAWSQSSGSVSTFTLAVGNGNGWDLTGITSYAAWLNAGFGNQRYDISIRRVGESEFTFLKSVNYQPFSVTGTGASKVTVSGAGGTIARRVQAIRFTMLQTNGNGGRAVYREIDLTGSPSASIQPEVLGIQSPGMAAAGKVSVTWRSSPGKTYRVEATENLRDWSVLTSVFPSGGITTTLKHDAGPTTEGKQFFRVSENP